MRGLYGCLVFLSALPTVVLAADPLELVPASALGVAVVRNLAETDARLQQVAGLFAKATDSPVPAPLAMVKLVTGLGAGLDESGDAVLALLPGDGKPRPLIVLPASDYGEFAEAVGADPGGDICRVTVAGEEVLSARRDQFVVLMNVEDRSVLEQLLTATPTPNPTLTKLSDWLDAQSAAVVLLPAGAEMLLSLSKAGLSQEQAEMEENFSDPQFAEMLEQSRQSLAMTDAVLGLCGAKVEAAAAGLAVDASPNVRLSGRVLLKQDDSATPLPESTPADSTLLSGHAADPFVVAVGYQLTPDGTEMLAKSGRAYFEQLKTVYGFQDLTEADWNEMEDCWRTMIAGVRSYSMVMRPGEDDDPLMSNMATVMRVDDAERYLKSLRQSFERWGKIAEKSTSDLKAALQYDFEETQVEGRPALVITNDFATAADPRVPMMEPMLKAMFGEDGKMHITYVAVDEDVVVSAVGDAESLAAAIKAAAAAETGLAEDAQLDVTTKLFDPKSTFRLWISPPGVVAWFERLIKNFAPMLGGPTFDVPEYPATPPIGLSGSIGAEAISWELVWPADALRKLAEYIETCRKANL